MSILMSSSKASEYLGISIWTLYRWTKEGRVPYVQLGRRKLFDISDLEQFIENHKIKVTDR